MCARVAERVTLYSVLGRTMYNMMKCSAVCVYCGMAGCVMWLWELWCTSYVSTVIQFL